MRRVGGSTRGPRILRRTQQGAIAADFGADDPQASARTPSTPRSGYEIVEIALGPDSPALGRHVADIPWTRGCLVVAVTAGPEIVPTTGATELTVGERVILLAPARHAGDW